MRSPTARYGSPAHPGSEEPSILRYVARTASLALSQRQEIARMLTAATGVHPWPQPLPAAWIGQLDRREPQSYMIFLRAVHWSVCASAHGRQGHNRALSCGNVVSYSANYGPRTRTQTRAARRQNPWSGGIFGVVLMTLEGVPAVKLLLVVGAASTLALAEVAAADGEPRLHPGSRWMAVALRAFLTGRSAMSARVASRSSGMSCAGRRPGPWAAYP